MTKETTTISSLINEFSEYSSDKLKEIYKQNCFYLNNHVLPKRERTMYEIKNCILERVYKNKFGILLIN